MAGSRGRGPRVRCVWCRDRTNHHLFQPLPYQVVTAGLSGPDIAAPLRHILRPQGNVTVRMDEVRDIDVAQRLVTLAGCQLDYDHRLVANGSNRAYFGHDDRERFAPGTKILDDALAIRRHILGAFEAAKRESDSGRHAAWLSFLLISAKHTGVALADTLAEVAHHTLPSECRVADPRTAQIHLVKAGPRVLASMPLALSTSEQHPLERMGVRVHLNTAVRGVDDTGAKVLASLLYAALGGSLFFLPLNLIQLQGYGATAAGAASLTFVAIMFLLSCWAGSLVDFSARSCRWSSVRSLPPRGSVCLPCRRSMAATGIVFSRPSASSAWA